jgi:anti-sigma regulatory factor (Ser/Thr protein kinase)
MEAEQSLYIDGKQSRTIRLTVSPHANFREAIRALAAITIPPTRVSGEHIRFAVLELLNNSIRAQKEKGDPRDISIDMTASDGRLVVSIRDYGGGFDPGKLPYDLAANSATLDLRSSPFEEYQRQNGYKRFGMGLYIAKKTFDDFRLVFLDQQDRPTHWAPGQIAGTIITVSVGTKPAAVAASEANDGE